MTLSQDIMTRVHQGELTPGAAFALQARRDTPTAARYRVPCLIGETVSNSAGFRNMAEWFLDCGVRLEVSHDFSHYGDRWKRARNWATWGVKWNSPTYRRGKKRVLFIENGLLSQSSGFYVDDEGYFADSSIVQDRRGPTHAEVAAMQRHCETLSGRPWFSGGDPTGPVMVALQDNRDGAVRVRQYPLRGDNPNAATIRLASMYLPSGTPVVVRRHPLDKTAPPTLPPDWAFDAIPDKWASLARCRAMATATSTLATEALAIGLPVAALGHSCWRDSGAVLECADNPSQLRRLTVDPRWTPEEWPAILYLCSVLRHQVGYHDTRDRIETLPPLRRWIGSITGVEPAETISANAAAEWLEVHGTDAHRAEIDRWRNCRNCARGRLARNVIDLARAAGYAGRSAA